MYSLIHIAFSFLVAKGLGGLPGGQNKKFQPNKGSYEEYHLNARNKLTMSDQLTTCDSRHVLTYLNRL